MVRWDLQVTDISMNAGTSAETGVSDIDAADEADHRLIAHSVLALANLLRRSGNIAYKSELGLSSISWSVIARLGAEGPMTQTELVELTLFDKGQLSRAAVELADKGLILRNRRNWRTIELRLTHAGFAVYSAINRISRTRHEALTAGVSNRDLEIFFRTLDAVFDNAKSLLQTLKSEDGDTG